MTRDDSPDPFGNSGLIRSHIHCSIPPLPFSLRNVRRTAYIPDKRPCRLRRSRAWPSETAEPIRVEHCPKTSAPRKTVFRYSGLLSRRQNPVSCPGRSTGRGTTTKAGAASAPPSRGRRKSTSATFP